ncbi:MAG: ATP-binding protein [Clostridiales Family XIII bacterium]|jgi:hypothetical protein|nr:ATP-binding protein [Clostridiales Family XIII bacterium]
MEELTRNIPAILIPPRLIICAYALGNGATADKIASALGLANAPEDAVEAWRRYEASPPYPPIEAVCAAFGLDDFARFALSLAFASELDATIPAALAALGGTLTASFATRLFSGSVEEAVLWRARWLSAEQALTKVFTAPEALKLRPEALNLMLDASITPQQAAHLGHGIGRLAAKINTAFCWDDLVLPQRQKALLRHVCDRVRYDGAVYGEWDFGKKVTYGRGVRALFAGPPGTGKTMAAQIVANELGMELYRVDLSALVSKYIGETEKNIDEVFREAEKSGGILFFDEADAVFGKRGEQKDSHDKYANMQTAFLLQRVEDYDGVALLATNFVSNLDAAFIRRIQIRVDFPAPDEAARLSIWRALLRAPVPVAADIDTPFLAKRFETTGSEIKNVVLTAAFLAAAEKGEITMGRLIRALVTEYAKIDKILSAKDLGEYADEMKTADFERV